MPLSADGILGFFDGTTRRCEAFEHVALTASGFFAASPATAASPAPQRFRGTPVLEPGGGAGADTVSTASHSSVSSVIPTATAMPHASSLSSCAEVQGTLYICALPEALWGSIAAVTATSAPSQRQLGFLSEAPAFSTSRNTSFTQVSVDSPQSAALKKAWTGGETAEGRGDRGRGGRGARRPEDEELPEMSAFGSAEDTQPRAATRRDTQQHRDPFSGAGAGARYHAMEDHRRRQGSQEYLPPTTTAATDRGGRGAGSAESPAEEGIQLPNSVANIRPQVSSSVFRNDSVVYGSDPAVSWLQGGAFGAGGNHQVTTSVPQPPPPPSRASASDALANPLSRDDALHAGTVTVLLWVAADAFASAEEGDAASSSRTPPPKSLSPRTAKGSDPHGLQLAAGSGEHNTRRSSNGSAGATGSTLPACLCFGVRDIARAESGDTDVMTTRERRVQRFTLLLESGAPVYTARSTSDILASVNATAADAGWSTSSLPVPSYGTTSFLPPSGELSCSFIFYQGGITRCVASLRRHSPTMAYSSLGARLNSSSSGVGLSSPAALSRTVSSQAGLWDSHAVEVPGTATAAGPPNGFYTGSPSNSLSHLPWTDGDGGHGGERGRQRSPPLHGGPEQQRSGKTGGGGWRNRLSPAALFGHSKHAGSPSSPALRSPNVTPQTSLMTTALAAAAAGVVVGGAVVGAMKAHASKGVEEGERTRAQAPPRALPGGPAVGVVTPTGTKAANDDAAGHSSNSSFEDLGDEMTAVRLGACYIPPKPSLPPVEPTSSATLVTAAEWEKVFDTVPSATTTTAPGKPAKVLNRERWRAFRQSLYERGGLVDSSVRFEVWCYLLGAYVVGSTAEEQREVLAKEKELYTRLTTQWKSFLPEQEEHFAVYRYAKHSIIKDVERTDRTHPAFRDDKSDMLRILQELLLAHVMYNMDLGYSQGMSDVAAIASLVAPACAEPAMFMCFRKMLSEHMANNFVIEERKKDAPYAAVKGLQRKLYQVQVLTRHFHPRLYGHLKMRCMAEDMTFCFRWLLVCFKRDLGSLTDTMRFWDVLFACPYTKSYEVIVTVALLVALAPQIITHIHAYETLLQFMNVLSSGTTVDQIVQCAREFYENVCVIETRELRRQQRQAVSYAAALRAQDAGADRLRGGSPRASAAPPTATAQSASEDSEHFPTVEEMVLLFLATDGPL